MVNTNHYNRTSELIDSEFKSTVGSSWLSDRGQGLEKGTNIRGG